jgi:small subunit ribosomal protein S4e
MARHGNSRHLNRLASSRYAKLSKKTAKYLAKPAPGRHKLLRSVALLALLRDKLGVAANASEARKIIKGGGVQVNGRRVSDDRYPVGFGDVVELVQTKEAYAVGVGKGGVIRIEKAKAHDRTLKVVGKYLARGKKVMLRLYDGSAVAGDEGVKVNDSVVLSGGKVKAVLRFVSGARCIVIDGAHASEAGVIREIKAGNATTVAEVKVESGGAIFETPADNVMVVGD